MDYSLPDSSVHEIFQASILEWVPFPSPGYLSNQGIKPKSLALKTDSLPAEPPGKPHLFLIPHQISASLYGFPNLPLSFFILASLVAQTIKRLPAMQETGIQSLGREDPLEK